MTGTSAFAPFRSTVLRRGKPARKKEASERSEASRSSVVRRGKAVRKKGASERSEASHANGASRRSGSRESV